MGDGGDEGMKATVKLLREEKTQLQDELRDARQEFETSLQQKTEQMQQATTIGQDLFEKNRDLKDELDDAVDAQQAATTRTEQLEAELEGDACMHLSKECKPA